MPTASGTNGYKVSHGRHLTHGINKSRYTWACLQIRRRLRQSKTLMSGFLTLRPPSRFAVRGFRLIVPGETPLVLSFMIAGSNRRCLRALIVEIKLPAAVLFAATPIWLPLIMLATTLCRCAR